MPGLRRQDLFQCSRSEIKMTGCESNSGLLDNYSELDFFFFFWGSLGNVSLNMLSGPTRSYIGNSYRIKEFNTNVVNEDCNLGGSLYTDCLKSWN